MVKEGLTTSIFVAQKDIRHVASCWVAFLGNSARTRKTNVFDTHS